MFFLTPYTNARQHKVPHHAHGHSASFEIAPDRRAPDLCTPPAQGIQGRTRRKEATPTRHRRRGKARRMCWGNFGEAVQPSVAPAWGRPPANEHTRRYQRAFSPSVRVRLPPGLRGVSALPDAAFERAKRPPRPAPPRGPMATGRPRERDLGCPPPGGDAAQGTCTA